MEHTVEHTPAPSAGHHHIEPHQPAAARDEPAPHTSDDDLVRIELPGEPGGWAEIRDPRKMRTKHRKTILRRIGATGDKPDNERALELGLEIPDQLAIHLIERWHVPYLPGLARPADDPASMDELYIVDADAIGKVTEPAAEMLFPKKATVDGANTPGSPTPPAGG